MSEVSSLATMVPEHCVSAADTKRYLAEMCSPSAAARLLPLVDVGGNQTRFATLPLQALRGLGTLGARNQVYVEHAVSLGEEVARQALSKAAVPLDAVTEIVGVSSTGYAMPTLETRLLERLALPTTCRRIPMTQLGCAGGAAALGLAAALAGAPNSVVLIVSVELPSLSFPNAEPSPSDVMASMQFGDGAAALVVAGAHIGRGPEVLATGTCMFRNTLDRNEVHLTAAGFRILRPRGLESLLRAQLGDAVDQFLARANLRRDDIAFWIVHPRSPELLAAAGESLRLDDGALAASRAIWRRNGNMISASVFHVLEELRAATPPAPGALGLMIAFGAGFGCEMVLLRAGGWLSR